MKLGILTSSRADYGIYLPLLKRLKHDHRFHIEIIAFGMHLQSSQGYTLNEIKKDGYGIIHKVGNMPKDDSIKEIAEGYGKLIIDFANFWQNNSFDIVLVLGDRWEVSAAVQASIPFEVTLAHIHGGETTLGATDNIYRHQISLASSYHFTANEIFSKRVKSIIGKDEGIHTVGSISLEDIELLKLPQWDLVKKRFEIPFDKFILVTFHPESVGVDRNKKYAKITFRVLEKLVQSHNILITMSNSDALGSLYNNEFKYLASLFPDKVKLVDSLGRLNYFKAIEKCLFILGNSSSGIIEAASFNKWVINIGDRQKGRLRNSNVIDIPFSYEDIIEKISKMNTLKPLNNNNIYLLKGTSDRIISILMNHGRL